MNFKGILLGSSWATTAWGYVIAGLQAAQSVDIQGPDHKINWFGVGTAVAIALFGRYSKDHNATNAPGADTVARKIEQ